jgi:SSS family solute:Na+ symporter
MSTGLVLLLVYAVVLLVLAVQGWKKTLVSSASGNDDSGAFFVNDHKSSAVGVALSIVVSCVGASATIGMIGMAFTLGTPAFWWLGAGCVGLTFLSWLLAQKVRASGAMTMPQMVEVFLGKAARPLISVIIVLAWLAILAAQFVAISKVLEFLTPLPILWRMILSFLLIVAHTFGGQAAIMRTDKLQAGIMLLALVALFVFLFAENHAHNPGWLGNIRFEAVNEDFPMSKLFYYFFVVGGNYLVCPMLFGRFLSAKDVHQARVGGFMAVAGLALCAALIVGIGLACRGLLPPGTASDSVLTVALATLAPGCLSLFISIALISAIVSSADSCLVTASTVLAHDLLQRGNAGASRICVVLLGLGGLALSFWGKGILDYLLMAYDVYVCGVVTPVFIGLLLYPRYKITPVFSCIAVCAGGVLGLVSAMSGNNYYSYAGIISAAALTLCGVTSDTSDRIGVFRLFSFFTPQSHKKGH